MASPKSIFDLSSKGAREPFVIQHARNVAATPGTLPRKTTVFLQNGRTKEIELSEAVIEDRKRVNQYRKVIAELLTAYDKAHKNKKREHIEDATYWIGYHMAKLYERSADELRRKVKGHASAPKIPVDLSWEPQIKKMRAAGIKLNGACVLLKERNDIKASVKTLVRRFDHLK